MKQASALFSDDDRKRVDEAVAAAESKTAAEIVPVVATASGRYDRAEDIVGLWVGLAALVLLWWLLPATGQESGAWDGLSPWLVAGLLMLAVLIGFVAGAVAASRLLVLRRLFTPRAQMRDEVQAMAKRVFFDSSVHHTAGGSGVLVFVSLYERMAAVLADRKVLESLGQEEVDRLCQQLVDGLRSGGVTDALVGTLERAGEKLGAVLPRANDDVNELPDALVTLD